MKTGRLYCSNTCKFSDIEFNKKRVSLTKNPSDKLIRHIKTGKTFTDVHNKSGILGKYSRNILGHDLDMSQWEIVDKPKKPVVDCPYCKWSTTDVKNKSGALLIHCHKLHHKTREDIINEFPAYADYLLGERYTAMMKRIDILNSVDGGIECQICGERFKTLSNSHLKLHNISQREYKEQYGHTIVSMMTSNTLSEQWQQNEGLKQTNFISKPERDIAEYYRGRNIRVMHSNRQYGTEFDLYFPDNNVVIEFNGLYWHKEQSGKYKNYHLNKTIIAEKNNLQLIHIFEDEWLNRKEIVLSRINSILGLNSRKIYARKCEVREISSKMAINFINEFHLQGGIGAKIHYGLFDEDILVSVMNFSKRNITGRFNCNEWELLRFCNIPDVTVIGGADKILKHFIKTYHPTNIISYADRRYSQGKLYEKLGFKLTSIGSPNYWYIINRTTRRHRYNYTKYRILQKFPMADPNLSEYENMLRLGYDRIWDCGSLKYELTLTDNTEKIH